MAKQVRTPTTLPQPKAGLPYQAYLGLLEDAEHEVRRHPQDLRGEPVPAYSALGQYEGREQVGEGCYRCIAPPAL